MDQRVVTETLHDIAEHRRRTRSVIRATGWYPMVVFSVITLVSTVPVETWGDASLGWYWPIAAIAGNVLTARHAYRHQHDRGVVGNATPYALTAAGIVVGACLMGALGRGDVRLVGPWLVVAAGCMVFAYLDRSVPLAAYAGSAAVWSLLVAAAGPGHAYTVIAAPLGAGGLVLGLRVRLSQKPC